MEKVEQYKEEIKQIREVVAIARIHGFGNIISVLRKEWADALLNENPKLPIKAAEEATIVSPYKNKWW